MTETNISSQKTFYNIIFAGVLMLFIISNFVLVVRYRQQRGIISKLQAEENSKKSTIRAAGLQEMANLQGELRAWSILEEAVELFIAKKYQQALKKFDQSIRYKPITLAYYFRAQTNYHLQNLEHALEDITIYQETIPTSNYGLLWRARIYIKLDKKQQAQEDLEQLLSQKKDFQVAQQMLQQLAQKSSASNNQK